MTGKKGKNSQKKKRKISDGSINNGGERKSGRFTSTPEEVIVSSVLKETNSVLYDEENIEFNATLNLEDLLNNYSVSETDVKNQAPVEMASNSPSNADLMTILNKINNRLESVEKKT